MKASFLITAGPTRERIDPIRFISNYSTGTFGYVMAKEARRRGFRTTLISGPVSIEAPRGIRLIRVETALEMRDAVRRQFKNHSCLIMASAVSDWRAANRSRSKIKRGKTPFSLRLVPNPDIVAEAARHKGGRAVVGFALETGGLIKNAVKKLKKKNLDLIVANQKSGRIDAFGGGLKEIVIIDRKGNRRSFRGKTKAVLAKIILDKVLEFNI